ncbi:hypothetical protein LINGRAHAP2_LOCUS36190 [Linum grandiflorum]
MVNIVVVVVSTLTFALNLIQIRHCSDVCCLKLPFNHFGNLCFFKCNFLTHSISILRTSSLSVSLSTLQIKEAMNMSSSHCYPTHKSKRQCL